MASELPDALEKLALKAERNENDQESSLSKYFGQPDNADDIFDTIVKPGRSEVPEEPKVNFFKSPASTPMKEDSRRDSPSVAFKKGEEDEPKIFSYFSQPTPASETNKNNDATEFFDQISQMASKSHEPIEISSSGFSTTPQPLLPTAATSTDSSAPIQQTLPSNYIPVAGADTNSLSADKTNEASGVRIPSPGATSSIQPVVNNVPQPTTRQLFTPQSVSNVSANEPKQPVITWSSAEERASRWWIPSETTKKWLESLSSAPIQNVKLSQPGLMSNTELVGGRNRFEMIN